MNDLIISLGIVEIAVKQLVYAIKLSISNLIFTKLIQLLNICDSLDKLTKQANKAQALMGLLFCFIGQFSLELLPFNFLKPHVYSNFSATSW